MATGTVPQRIPDLPLDPGLLELGEEEVNFFTVLTGIKNDEELKEHIVDVTAKAYGVGSFLSDPAEPTIIGSHARNITILVFVDLGLPGAAFISFLSKDG